MFLKQTNSDTDNDNKKNPKSHLTKKKYKTGKVKNEMNHNNTVIGWLPNLKKKHFYAVFHFKRLASF